jgi:hypothetical protein
VTVTFDGSGGLFTRLGKIGYALSVLNDFRGSTSADKLTKEVLDVLDEYASATTALRDAVDHLVSALPTAQQGLSGMTSALSTAATNTLIEQLYADVVANGAALNPMRSRSLAEALDELVAQMLAGSKTVDANEPTITLAAGGSNAGNGNLVASLLDGQGRRLEYVLPEQLVALITSSTTAGRETWRVDGEPEIADKLSHLWPGGSGIQKTGITSLDAATESATQNLVANGDFEDFTSNTPNSWTVSVGTPGTHIKEEATDKYKGAKALEYDGDASNLTAIYQALTVASLASRTPYALNFWLKTDSVPAAGVLVVDLFDGTSVINDDAGTANSLSIDLTAITTSFVAKSAFFRLPDPVPATVRLRIRLSTALSNTSSIFIDHLALAKSTPLYTGGPYVAFFSGATDWELDDKFTLAVANDFRGALATLCERLFSLRDKGIWLPSATGAAETIADSLLG